MKEPTEVIERGFHGVWIPKSIWLHPKLTWLQKCILAEIKSLSTDGRVCWASNSYLADKFDMTPETFANHLVHLRRLGMVETVCFDGRKRHMKVTIGYDNDDHGKREGLVHRNREGSIPGTRDRKKSTIIKENLDENLKEINPPNPQGGLMSDSSSNSSSATKPDIAEEIYAAYPKQTKKPSALKAIRAAMKRKDPGVLLETVKRFAAPWIGKDTQMCPAPAVWFAQACFDDDPATWNRPSNQNGSLADLRLKKGALEDRIDHLRAETQYEMHKNHHEMIAEWKQCEKKLEAVNNQIIAA